MWHISENCLFKGLKFYSRTKQLVAFHTICIFEIKSQWRYKRSCEFWLASDERWKLVSQEDGGWWGPKCDASLTYTECILNRRNSGIPSVYVTRDTTLEAFFSFISHVHRPYICVLLLLVDQSLSIYNPWVEKQFKYCSITFLFFTGFRGTQFHLFKIPN